MADKPNPPQNYQQQTAGSGSIPPPPQGYTVLQAPTAAPAPQQNQPGAGDKSGLVSGADFKQKSLWKKINDPLYTFQHPLDSNDPAMQSYVANHPYMAAAEQTAKQLTEGFTSPLSIALLAAGPVGKLLGKGAALAEGAAATGKTEAALTSALDSMNAAKGAAPVSDANTLWQTIRQSPAGQKALQSVANVATAGQKAMPFVSRGAQGAIAANGIQNTAQAASPIMSGNGNMQDYLNLGAGMGQTFLGGYGASRGLFSKGMNDPYIVPQTGKPLFKPDGNPYTKAEFYDTATKQGLQPDLQQATQSPSVGVMKDYLSKSLFGRAPFLSMDKANAEAVAKGSYEQENGTVHQSGPTEQFRQTVTPPMEGGTLPQGVDIASLGYGLLHDPRALLLPPAEYLAARGLTSPSLINQLTKPAPNTPTHNYGFTAGQAASQGLQGRKSLFGK